MRTLILFTFVTLTALAQPRFFNEIQVQNIIRPIAGSSPSLGNAGNRWANVFTNSLVVSSGLGNGVSNHFIPATNNVWDLGFSGNRWRNGFFAGNIEALGIAVTNANSSLIPSSSAFSLGGPSSSWNGVHGIYGYFQSANPMRFIRFSDADNSLVTFEATLCGASCTWSIGNVNDTFASFQIQRGGSPFVKIDTTGLIRLANSIIPDVSGVGSIGRSSSRWANGFFNVLTLSDGAGQGFSSNIVPISNYVWQLGNSSYRWDVFFGRFANLQSNAGSLAGFSIRDTSSAERAYLGDGGGTGGELRLINSAGFEFFGAINGVVRANGTNAITTTVTVPCGTLTFTQGLLTSKGTCP